VPKKKSKFVNPLTLPDEELGMPDRYIEIDPIFAFPWGDFFSVFFFRLVGAHRRGCCLWREIPIYMYIFFLGMPDRYIELEPIFAFPWGAFFSLYCSLQFFFLLIVAQSLTPSSPFLGVLFFFSF